MRIESIHLKNFKALQDVKIDDLQPLSVFVGANGVGKTTLFDAFGFLHDCLVDDVRAALDKRGGFREVVSRNQTALIEVELKYRDADGPLTTYQLQVGAGEGGLPVVEREVLRFTRGTRGRPWHLLDFRRGSGKVLANESESTKAGAKERREPQTLDAPYLLAVKGVGQFRKYQGVAAFRRLIERWYVSDFHIEAARQSVDAGVATHLSESGENLPLVARFMYEQHRARFDQVLRKMQECVPGISKVEAKQTEDGRIVLRFQDGAFKDPFIGRYVSDGTIKMFAYLLLLNDPDPHPLLCVEEPENQLHPDLLGPLAEQFRAYAEQGQVMVTTHSPSFLNGARLSELYWLTKVGGYTDVHRAANDPNLVALAEAGDLPGYLWQQGLFRGAGPQ